MPGEVSNGFEPSSAQQAGGRRGGLICVRKLACDYRSSVVEYGLARVVECLRSAAAEGEALGVRHLHERVWSTNCSSIVQDILISFPLLPRDIIPSQHILLSARTRELHNKSLHILAVLRRTRKWKSKLEALAQTLAQDGETKTVQADQGRLVNLV